MKLIYIAGEYIANELPGVEKKIRDQQQVLEEAGIQTETVWVKMMPRLRRVIPFSSSLQWGSLQIPEADALYIRMDTVSDPFIRFLRKTRREQKNIKILVEIPTYPYDIEIKRLNILTQIRDRLYRGRLQKAADRIVTYSEDREIFGIPTIPIQNGINAEAVPPAGERKPDGEIHLIAVAALQAYHGYERIIEGLHAYYAGGGDRKIKFLIVGSGYAEEELRERVRQYGLKEQVIFRGAKTGDALSAEYDQADVGMGSFGLYKRMDNVSSALKTREYLARGLPVVSGCKEDVFEAHPADFYLEFENNETPVDIRKVIDFHDRVYKKGKQSLSERIRKFARETVDIRSTFGPVVRYILGKQKQENVNSCI